MPLVDLQFHTPDIHDVLVRALRFLRVAEIGVESINVERLPEGYAVYMSTIAESADALQLLARRIENIIGVADFNFERPAASQIDRSQSSR